MGSPRSVWGRRFGRSSERVIRTLDRIMTAAPHWLPPYLALWCLILLSDALSEPTVAVVRGASLAVLATLSVHAIGQRWRGGFSKHDGAYLALMLFGAAGSFLDTAATSLFAAAWIAGTVGLDRRTRNASALMRCAVMIGVVGTILSGTPWLWNVLNRLAVLLTTALFSWAGGGGLGAAASGLSLLVLVSPCLVWAAVRRTRLRLAPLAAAITLFLVHAGASSLCGFPPRLRLAVEFIYAALLLLLCVGAVRGPRRVTEARRPLWRAVLPALVFLFAFACGMRWLPELAPGRSYAEPRTVLFVDHSLLGGWSTPAAAAPGAAFSGANFGLFPEYAGAAGHRVVTAYEIDEERIDGVDLVVIINPGAPFSEEEKETLYAFVRSGGGLLVLGDHTNMGGIMDAVNGLTAPLGLSLAFDSAASLDPGWSRELRVLPPFSERFRPIDVPVSIGASVDAAVHPAVAPFLVGRRAFSDPGEADNTERALLGNLAFDRGERYGDVVLAAVRYLGRGKVALFGDTSVFQNSALTLSYAFTDDLIRWLTDGTGAWRAPFVGALALLLLFGSVLLLDRSDVLVSGIVAIVFAAGVLCGTAVDVSPKEAGVMTGPTALIDASHGNLIRWDPLHTSGVEGLGVNLARNGFLPFVHHTSLVGSLPSPQSVVVSVAPTRSYSEREIRALLGWVEQGGGLLVTTGWPQSTALDPFLSRVGISVAPVPLGAVRPDVVSLDVQPQLPSAWPLETSPEWVPLGSVEWDDARYTVIAERAIGLGWIIVVGDNVVFLNENLEGKDYAYVENTALLSALLSRPRGVEEPS